MAGLSEYSQPAAEALGLRVKAAVEQLRAFPYSGRVVSFLQDQRLRELILGDYRLLYEVFVDRIEILGIVHGARDIGV